MCQFQLSVHPSLFFILTLHLLMSILCTCVSTPALQIDSSVPFFSLFISVWLTSLWMIDSSPSMSLQTHQKQLKIYRKVAKLAHSIPKYHSPSSSDVSILPNNGTFVKTKTLILVPYYSINYRLELDSPMNVLLFQDSFQDFMLPLVIKSP